MTPNVHEPRWDQELDRNGYRWQRAYVGRQAGAEQLGASLFDVPPGAKTFPLHAHSANEELLVVLSGRPTLRTLDGSRELAPGDVVAFPAGRRGAHTVSNASDAAARILVVSTMHAPEVNEFPDSGIVWARNIAPGTTPSPDDLVAVGRVGETFDPFTGDV